MNSVLEWSPLIVFFVVFKIWGIYWATGSLMVMTAAVMCLHRLQSGRFKIAHVLTACLALVLGGATLLLHDARFIQWKPTLLLGAAAIAFLGSNFMGKRLLAQRLLAGVFSEPIELPPRTWVLINSAWAGYFALLAAANLYIARHLPENLWVDFKVFGITAAMLIFMIPQVIWLNGKVATHSVESGT